MYDVLCAIIAIIVLLLIALVSMVLKLANAIIRQIITLSKPSPTDSVMLFGGSDEPSLTDMKRITTALSSQMSKGFKVMFNKLFTERYALLNQPVIVTLDDIKQMMPYEPDTKVFRTSTHIGQRKLFNTELQFLTDHMVDGSTTLCVYAGAAPSNHTGLLSALFPSVKFVLVDPSPFNVFEADPVVLWSIDDAKKANGSTPPMDDLINRVIESPMTDGSPRIFIINDLFTVSLSESIRRCVDTANEGNGQAIDLLFVSDIRTNMENLESPSVTDILWNLAQQYNWIRSMRPRLSMLKFRHPFYAQEPAEEFIKRSKLSPFAEEFEAAKAHDGIDFVTNAMSQRLVYFDGTINIQTFPGTASTETRLITDGSVRDWGDSSEYEGKLFYYNLIERSYCHHVNDNADRALGFDHCNDCALENYLWKRYIARFPNEAAAVSGQPQPSVKSFVSRLSHNTLRPLVRENHGRFFSERYPTDALIRAAELRVKTEGKVYLWPKNTSRNGHNGRSHRK